MNSKGLTFRSIFSIAILLFSLFFFSNSIYAQKEFSVRNVGHFGGYASTVAVSGNYAFFCQGPVLSVLEITESGFIKKASLTLPAEPGESFIYNNYLYLSQWFDSLRVIDIVDPLNPVLVASLHVRQGGANWGRAKITASGNYLYLTLGDSVKVIDISIPETPAVAKTILTSANDIFVRDNYAYLGSNDRFKIYDLTDVENPTEVGSCSISMARAVSVQGNFAYLGVDQYPDIGLQIIDISNPANPTKLSFFETKYVEGNHTWFKSPFRIAVKDNYAYVGCLGSAWLHIVDISNPANPATAGTLNFEEGSFPNFQSMQLQYPYLYAATGASSVGLIQVNISASAFPEIEHRYEEPWNAQSMATRGDTLFVSSFDRLWVYDYSDTSRPLLLGSDTTWAELSKIQVQNNYLYGTNENNFHILDVADPNNIFEVGNYSSANGDIIELVVYENFVYLLTVNENQSLLEIVNITDPNLPVKETGEFILPGNGRDFCLLPDSMFALVAYSVDETNQGFQIIDISDLSELIVLGSAQTAGNPIAIGVADTLAIVGSNTIDNWHLEVFNIVDPTNPVNIGSTDGGGFSRQRTVNSHPSFRNSKLVRLNKSAAKIESFSSSKYSIPQQSELGGLRNIAAFTIISGLNFGFENKIFLAASIPNGSLHFFFLEPGVGTVEWVLQAICHSPASTVIAAIAHQFYMTIFSIDGWLDPITKQVSGSWGTFVQRLILKTYLAEIKIVPQDTTISWGDTLQYQAQGYNNRGDHTVVSVDWSASGGTISSTGLYAGTEVGQHQIIATDTTSGISDSVNVNVTSPTADSIAVAPRDTTISFGDTLQYQVQGYDDQGNQVDVVVNWFASGGTIDPSGLYIGTEEGDFTITATDTNSGASGIASVHITPTGVVRQTQQPTEFVLYQNYPNPFNPKTSIEFSVKEKCPVVLSIFNIRGRQVIRLIDAQYQAGHFKVVFNANSLTSGIYFYKIQMKDFTDVKKMVLLE